MREWQSSMLVCRMPYLKHCWTLGYWRIVVCAQAKHWSHKWSKIKLQGVSRTLLSCILSKTERRQLYQIATHIVMTFFCSVRQQFCHCNLCVHELALTSVVCLKPLWNDLCICYCLFCCMCIQDYVSCLIYCSCSPEHSRANASWNRH